MTKLAILADIHGNLPALDAVLRDVAAEEGVDRIVVAGDLVNWGPFSAAVVERAVRENWAVIRGNHEFYVLDHDTPRAPPAWSDRQQYALLPWLRGQLGQHWRNVIGTWPDTLALRFADADLIRVVHGTAQSAWSPLYPDASDDELRNALRGIAEPIVIAGHTHIALDRRVDHWRILNPGSVGLPLDGTFEAQYLILESDGQSWNPSFRRVPYDRNHLFDEFERQRFRDDCGVIGELVLDEFRYARVHVHAFHAWRSTCCPGRPIDDNLLEEFRRVDWQPFVHPSHRW